MAQQKKKYFGVPFVLIISGFALALSLAIIIGLHAYAPADSIEIVEQKFILPPKSIWFVIGEHLATALFILAVWHALDQIFVRKEFNSEVIEYFDDAKLEWVEKLDQAKLHFETAKHDSTFGLVSTYHEASQFGFSSMIENSNRLVAVMADGYSWLGRHNEAFMTRFADPSKQTTIILVHPKSDIVDVLSRKIGMSPQLYRERIYQTVRELRKLAGSNANLKVVGHSLINCHSLYIADKEVVFSPYFLSTQRRIPPVIVLRDAGSGSFFQKLVSDVSFLEKECGEISDIVESDETTPIKS